MCNKRWKTLWKTPGAGPAPGGFVSSASSLSPSVEQVFHPTPSRIQTPVYIIPPTSWLRKRQYSRSRAPLTKRYRDRPCAAAHSRYFSAVSLGSRAPTRIRRAWSVLASDSARADARRLAAARRCSTAGGTCPRPTASTSTARSSAENPSKSASKGPEHTVNHLLALSVRHKLSTTGCAPPAGGGTPTHTPGGGGQKRPPGRTAPGREEPGRGAAPARRAKARGTRRRRRRAQAPPGEGQGRAGAARSAPQGGAQTASRSPRSPGQGAARPGQGRPAGRAGGRPQPGDGRAAARGRPRPSGAACEDGPNPAREKGRGEQRAAPPRPARTPRMPPQRSKGAWDGKGARAGQAQRDPQRPPGPRPTTCQQRAPLKGGPSWPRDCDMDSRHGPALHRGPTCIPR